MGSQREFEEGVRALLHGERKPSGPTPKVRTPLEAAIHERFAGVAAMIQPPNPQGDPGALDPATPEEVRAAIRSWGGDRERMLVESTRQALRGIGWKSGADLRREDEEAARAAREAAEQDEEDEEDEEEPGSASAAELSAWEQLTDAERSDALEGGPSLARWQAAVAELEEAEET